MKTRNIIAYAAAALALAGCQRESLVPELGTPYDGIVKFAPAVTGIGSGSAVGVRSGLSDGSAVIGSESLTLSSADGRFTIPMSLSTTGADAEGVKSLAGTRAALINDPGSEPGEIKPLVGEFAALTDNTFWVAAWDMPDDDDPSQCIPDADAKAFTGYVSGDVDNGFYQKVMYRTKDAEGEDLETPYWMTVQPGSADSADDEYKWKKNEAQKTFYAYANVPVSATMAQLNDEGTLKQTLTLTELPDADILMGYYEGDGSTGDPEKQTGTAKIQFHHPLAAVKFKAGTLASGVTISGVAIEKIYGKVGEGDAGKLMVTQDGHSFTWTRADGAAFKDANLLPEVSAACDGDAVLVIPQSLPSKARIRVTLQKGGETFNVYTTLSGSWSAGYVYTYTIGYNPPPEELLPGMFSVSATKYVQFSRGNLFCTRSGSEGEYSYSFAMEDKQYEYHTRYGVPHQNSSSKVVDAESFPGLKHEKDRSGLFQWVSTNAQDQTPDILAGYGAFSELGGIGCTGNASDIIDFGKAYGNGTTWSTLTSDEMQYLLDNHITKWSTVCGVKGCILAPDGWTGSIADSYDASSWPAAESAGLVFLPAAGNFNVENYSYVYNVSTQGYVWSQSSNSETTAHYMDFSSAGASKPCADRYYAMSVRLVQKFVKSVKIGKLYWATENLAITASGKREFNNTGHIIGDYFQWAAYAGYCGNATDADKGLLIYTSFTSMMCGDASDAFTFKSGKQFIEASTPYYHGSSYEKYTSDNVNLEKSDDVANIILGDDWRMPTFEEFKAMRELTYWAWDDTDKGYYVYMPKNGNDKGHFYGEQDFTPTGSYSTEEAVLFFPAAAYGSVKYPEHVGKFGLYWSSSLVSGTSTEAYDLYFHSEKVNLDEGGRYSGLPVRPVRNAD